VRVECDHDTTERIRVAFAGNERAIACHTSGLIDIHDIGSRTKSIWISGTDRGGIDVDPSGQRLAIVTQKGCAVWEISSGKKLCEVDLVGAEKCSFSPEGRSFVVAKRGCVIEASSADGSRLRQTNAIDRISDADCCRRVDCSSRPNGIVSSWYGIWTTISRSTDIEAIPALPIAVQSLPMAVTP